MGVPNHSNPIRFHAILALILCATGTVGLWWLFELRNTWPVWIGCWLVTVNVVAIGYYAFDKARARAGHSRVPEVVLHGLSALGGSPGAFLAMGVFRHKTIKGSFRILFWCIVILQIAIALTIGKQLM